MSWYNSTGPMQTHVLYTKVKYVRNPKDTNFYHISDQKRADELFSRLKVTLEGNGFRGENVSDKGTVYLLSLAEKQLAEHDFVYSDRPRALYFNEPCNLTVALGGDNYISISSTAAGLALKEAHNMSTGAEELIDREIPFAYSDRLGYLSPNISECGSGATFSSALYLPSLRLLGDAARRMLSLTSLNMTLSPMMQNEGNGGDVYLLSYSPHYLSDEESAVAHFTNTVTCLVEKEETILSTLFKERKKLLYDKARRALGTLLYSESISENEMLSLLSDIRLYHSVNKCAPVALPHLSDLNYLTVEGLNASMLLSSGEKCNSIEELNCLRATLIKKYLNEKTEVS